MTELSDFSQIKTFFLALAWTQPRILGLFALVPIFPKGVLPGILRMGLAAGLGVVVAPSLMNAVDTAQWDKGEVIFLLVKEAFVGLTLGFLISVPFWAFEAMGFVVDNQRGASISGTLNPLTSDDSSPLGILFSQAFIVFFFISGGFLLMLETLYGSFRIWNVFAWTPTFRAESISLLIAQLSQLVVLMLLMASPMIVAMLLAEMGLALVSRFVPQLQVFFLAMPIKSALAFLVLVLYVGVLFDYAQALVGDLPKILEFLDDQWRPAAGPLR
jgi:type III secretion protein T